MPLQLFDQALILLAASVVVIALARRLGLPAILGYLIVGVVLGPTGFDVLPNTARTQDFASIGVVFLLFTLGLEVSFPRMIAMRREVFGLGSAQTLVIAAVGGFLVVQSGMRWAPAIVVGGALAMCSTAIVLQQLGAQDELGRTHGRLSFAVLLFQDLAFVPLLTLATVLSAGHGTPGAVQMLRLVALGVVAMVIVLVIGRWVLRPLLVFIAHGRLRELFTLTSLLIVLISAWITQWLGFSMALGAFLAGLMFAETEYRHQIESVIRPFRELLLGLFFISVGLLLDLHVLRDRWLLIAGLLASIIGLKVLLTTLVIRLFGFPRFKALRTSVVLSGGGEFGVALLTLLAQGPGLLPVKYALPLLTTVVLSMVISPMLVRYNRVIARSLLGESGPPVPDIPAALAAVDLPHRDHVMLCGYGRVGRNLARVLVAQGFEYLAVDLDPARVREARQAGEPVLFGDCADQELLNDVGLAKASVVVITFADARIALGILRAVRHVRADVPILVRTQDDSHLQQLRAAGATEVVPETFEASLTLVSQVLTLLQVPGPQARSVVRTLREQRYSTLASDPRAALFATIVLSPGSWSVGRTLDDVRSRGVQAVFSAVRRHGITGRDPSGDFALREGDIVVIEGSAEELEHAEKVLLAG